jgi:hypothetical protein
MHDPGRLAIVKTGRMLFATMEILRKMRKRRNGLKPYEIVVLAMDQRWFGELTS